MLKKLNSFSNVQLLITVLFFATVSYLFSFAIAIFSNSVACATDVCNSAPYEMSNVVGGIILAMIVSFIILDAMTPGKVTRAPRTVKTVKKPTTKKKKK